MVSRQWSMLALLEFVIHVPDTCVFYMYHYVCFANKTFAGMNGKSVVGVENGLAVGSKTATKSLQYM